MLFSARPPPGMGAPPLQVSRHFPQWSRTALLTLATVSEDDVEPQVKKSPPESAGSGFIIGGNDHVARVAHLEHSVRFLQEQHRLMLSGLHAEIEALRERNRDLQFQLIFNKESSPKTSSTPAEDSAENNEEARLKREVTRLEREAAAARGEARAAEARALQMQRLIDAQAEKLRELDVNPKCSDCAEELHSESGSSSAAESRGELRARLAEAERLVRRLRTDAERQRRELQCMKNSLHASLRASGLDGGFGYQNNYHFPPVHTPDFWREPLRDDFIGPRGRSTRRPLTLPELSGQQIHRSTVYANNHTRPRANGYEKNKKPTPTSGEPTNANSQEEAADSRLESGRTTYLPNVKPQMNYKPTYPELKIVVTKFIHHGQVSASTAGAGGAAGAAGAAGAETRARARRPHPRKHAPDHT